MADVKKAKIKMTCEQSRNADFKDIRAFPLVTIWGGRQNHFIDRQPLTSH